MFRLNLEEMEGWITRSEALVTQIDGVHTLAQNLATQITDAYSGEATEENKTFTTSLSDHMDKLWLYHTVRTQHMKNTLERMKRCDEELAKGNNDLLTVRRLMDEAYGNRPEEQPAAPGGAP
jgi:hypothetical protein